MPNYKDIHIRYTHTPHTVPHIHMHIKIYYTYTTVSVFPCFSNSHGMLTSRCTFSQFRKL